MYLTARSAAVGLVFSFFKSLQSICTVSLAARNIHYGSSMMEWLTDNKEWFFSGIGVFLLSLAIGCLVKKKHSSIIRQKQKTTKSTVSNQAAGNIKSIVASRDSIGKQIFSDHTTPVQANSVVIHHGVSYADVKSIASDVYKENMLSLSKEATICAVERAEHLTENFLAKLVARDPASMVSMQDPGMQMALFSAQREYARSGDSALEELLVDILVERSSHRAHSIGKIVLDESLTVVPKLTAEHLDAITINCILTRALVEFSSQKEFLKFIKSGFLPFCMNLSADNACYEHLEYAKCGSIMRVARWAPFGEIVRVRWPIVFPDATEEQACKEVVKKITETYPTLRNLVEVWEDSQLSKFDLTTVGVYVATANFKRVTGLPIDARTPVISPYVDGGSIAQGRQLHKK